MQSQIWTSGHPLDFGSSIGEKFMIGFSADLQRAERDAAEEGRSQKTYPNLVQRLLKFFASPIPFQQVVQIQ